jgi:hypothetical protein
MPAVLPDEVNHLIASHVRLLAQVACDNHDTHDVTATSFMRPVICFQHRTPAVHHVAKAHMRAVRDNFKQRLLDQGFIKSIEQGFITSYVDPEINDAFTAAIKQVVLSSPDEHSYNTFFAPEKLLPSKSFQFPSDEKNLVDFFASINPQPKVDTKAKKKSKLIPRKPAQGVSPSAQEQARIHNMQLTEEQAREFWSCFRKKSYLTKKVAETFLVEQMPNPQDYHAYTCDHCDFWHVGHPVTGVVEKSYLTRLHYSTPRDKAKLFEFKERLARAAQYQTA